MAEVTKEAMVGEWVVTVKGPTGGVDSTLVVSLDNGEFSGSQTGEGTTSPATDISLDGDTFFWKNKVSKPMQMTTEFTGTVAGDEMTGKIKAGFMGKFPFTAKKQA